MKREFLSQFLNKISDFPSWVKEIIYRKLGEDVTGEENFSYVFASYRPVLTYKGKCENDFRKSGFDTNIYNILDFAANNSSISEIALNTYFSLEEIAGYFLFCLDAGFFEIPDDSRIVSIAGLLAGKFRIGEFFLNSGVISQNQLNGILNDYENAEKNKKFGQFLLDGGLISQKQLDEILKIKEESGKRFVLDIDDVPKVTRLYTNPVDRQLEYLQKENKLLKTKLEQLLTMVKNNDK